MNVPSNIYNFSDYRAFLKDRYAQLKEVDPAFSFRYFSKQAGFGSPNYLKLVMDGKRNLSDEAIGKFAIGLRLDNHESEFFKFMVQANQCNDIQKQRLYEAKLLYLKELFKVKEVIPELYDYYHDWYHAAIRELVRNGSVTKDLSSIAQSLVPSITVEQAEASIELLKKLGFIKEVNGQLENGEGMQDEAVAQKIHHEQMAELAAQSIYMQGPETQGFESVTVSLPQSKVAELKRQINELIAAATEQGTAGNEDAIYQLNVQLFALTKPKAKVEGTTNAEA